MSADVVSHPGGAELRLLAAQVLARVVAGQTLDTALPPALAQAPSRDRGLISECCYGTLRHYFALSWLLEQLLRRPLKRQETLVRMLLLIGLYQCRDLRIPPYAAVSSTAEAARRLAKPWAVSLINGVLRGFLRQRDPLLSRLANQPLASSDHPKWLLARLRQDWPDHWQDIVAANNTRPPMVLRVNRRRVGRPEYLQKLMDVGITAQPVAALEEAVLLAEPQDVHTLPGFADGLVSVQDAGAQWAAQWLAPEPGQRVLDACAAPGGKTCHVLECFEPGELVALDIDGQRLERVAENLQRLGLTATLRQGDLLNPEAWWDGQPFQRILLDAPCSGSGVIRRHPDIKLLRRVSDIPALAARQVQLLGSAWKLLAPGGRLVYVSCSIFQEENTAVLSQFLAHVDACEVRPTVLPGLAQPVGQQLLPGPAGTDGFYYACITRPR